MNKTKKTLLLVSLAASLGMGLMNVASADDHRPQYVHTVERGWHGDRYYDGHRYWARSEWERRHPVKYHHAPPVHHYY
ncbi:hypothetical protein [Caballeronia humi]|uniref:Lipoprotein n=1 Tax=Caballeronia humi TaxID=326474 RepID=A0A158FFS4_9BURK|nr:hypothetical protein [Caballeronia humi]SAL17880.1 lipoprotein [Caballeronia humi]